MKRDAAEGEWQSVFREAQASGKAHFAEKTPRHLLRIRSIRSMVPDARFVVMVRDGRDVAASLVRRRGTVEEGVERWVEENSALLRQVGSPDVHVQRYEDLIADPAMCLKTVCGFAGIPWAPEMLDYHKSERLWFGVESLRTGTGEKGEEHRNRRNWQINQPIFDGRGQWQELLSATDAAVFSEGKAAKLMKHFGYI